LISLASLMKATWLLGLVFFFQGLVIIIIYVPLPEVGEQILQCDGKFQRIARCILLVLHSRDLSSNATCSSLTQMAVNSKTKVYTTTIFWRVVPRFLINFLLNETNPIFLSREAPSNFFTLLGRGVLYLGFRHRTMFSSHNPGKDGE
jgi:hypothetical protein